MIKKDDERGSVLQSQLFTTLEGIKHYCSTRDMKDAELGVWMPHQVHGCTIALLDDAENPCESVLCVSAASAPVDADAVITRCRGQWIGVRTADCVPVLLYDPKAGVVAAVHAGWRGTVRHIVRLTAECMVGQLGCQAEELYAMVGPSISPEAFEVGEEVAQQFVEAGRADCVVRHAWDARGRQPYVKPHVDLWQSNVMDLLELGVDLTHIDCTPWCTVQNSELLYSARREGIGTGRIVSAIRLKP